MSKVDERGCIDLYKVRLDTVIWRLETNVKKNFIVELINQFCSISNMKLTVERMEEIQITKGEEYHFITDEGTRDFCDLVVEDMVEWYGISKEEAIARINSKWHGTVQLGFILDMHATEEEMPEYFYYGKPLAVGIEDPIIPKVPAIEKKYFEKIDFIQWTGVHVRCTFSSNNELDATSLDDKFEKFISENNLELYSPWFTDVTNWRGSL